MQVTVDKLNADWSRVEKYSLSGKQGFEVNINMRNKSSLENRNKSLIFLRKPLCV